MKINELDAVVFDVDGTLWDSTETVAQAWNQAIEAFGGLDLRLDSSMLQGLFGKTMDVICRQLFPSLSPAEQKRLMDLCYQCEHRLLREKPGILYPGVLETMELLSKEFPLYIVSNCQKGYIETLLECCGLGPFIEGHLCFGETGLPKSGTLLRLMNRFHLKHAVYVGDTEGDRQACLEARVPFIYASYGFGHVEGPEYAITSMDRLPALLRSVKFL